MQLISIQTKGDDGNGCYAGLEIDLYFTWFPLVKIPLFWKSYFAQDLAEEHDAACDLLDWTDVESAYRDYIRATEDFNQKCYARAAAPGADPSWLRQASAAAWATENWGRVRYLLCSSGYVF